MKNFLLVVSVGLIAVHAYGADRRTKSQNQHAQSQRLNQQNQYQQNRSVQQNSSSLAQSQRLLSERPLEGSRYLVPASLTASTPLPAPVAQPLTSLVPPTPYEPLEFVHQHFYPGHGYTMRDALISKYIKDNKIYMLFCARNQDNTAWRVGYVACNVKDGARQLQGSTFLYDIDIMDYTGDLFLENGSHENKRRREFYGVSSFAVRDMALTFIRNNSENFFCDLFKEIDKYRQEAMVSKKDETDSKQAPMN